MSMKNPLILTPVFLLVVLFAGCGGDDQDQASGKMVRYLSLGAKVRGMDPMDIGDTTSSSVASQIFESLYQYHYLKRPYELIPCLAEDFPTGEDQLTYTFKLRPGVVFADDPCFTATQGKGRQLVAADFIYAWKRIADVKNISKNWWIFEDHIVGLDEFRDYTGRLKAGENVDYMRPVEGLQAPDDFTLVVTLKRPWPQILYLLAHLPTAPVAREAVQYYGKSIHNHPVGTGPYMLKDWKRGNKIVMVRNPRFRQEFYPVEGSPGDREAGLLEDAGKVLPFVDEARWQVVEEDQPRWLIFMRGQLDASGIPKDFYNRAIDPSRQLRSEMKDKGIRLQIFRDPSTYWYGFNMEDPVVGTNKPLRQAMSMAINRPEYVEIFTNNRAEVAQGVIPPLFKEYDPEVINPNCQYNPERARELLKEAVEVHGGPLPTITISTPGTDTLSRQMGEYVTLAMDNIGLKVKIDYMDWPSFQDRIKTKSSQVFQMGWVADYPDPENFMQLFYSKNVSPGPNNFNYRNQAFDTLYEKAKAMPDSNERRRIYHQMENIIRDDCPAIFLVHGVAFVLHYNWLKNYKPHVFGYGLIKYQRIDVAARQKSVGR
ncbi:MAG: hypothetical protein GWP14_07595 [Actinobacteria bacterium]|nr:hypothetical protein [Actinomycetota bacterium]